MNEVQFMCWGFLISRTHYIDYGPIVVPDFIKGKKLSSLLAQAATGSCTELDSAIHKEIHNSKVGDLTLLYRVVLASSTDIGIEDFIEEDGKSKKCVSNDGILQDFVGRKISITEGIVLEGRQKDIKISKEDFEIIHKELMDLYRQTWELDLTRPILESRSKTITVEENGYLDYVETEPYILDSKQKKNSKRDFKKLNETKEDTKDSNPISALGDIYRNNSKLYKFIDKISFKRGEDRLITESVVFNPKNKTLFIRSGGDVQMVISYELLNSESTKKLFEEYSNSAIAVNNIKRFFGLNKKPLFHSDIAVSRNGQYVASGMINEYDRNIVYLFDFNLKTVVRIDEYLGSEDYRIKTLTFTSDNNNLITSSGNEIIFVDLASKISTKLDSPYTSFVNDIAVSNTDNLFASGYTNGNILIWDVIEKSVVQVFENYGEAINTLAFSPNSTIIASAGNNGIIKLWDYSKKEEIGILGRHSGSINSITFNSSGTILASAGDDCVVKIWNVKSRELIDILHNHNSKVVSIAYSYDDEFLVSSSKDHVVNLWKNIE